LPALPSTPFFRDSPAMEQPSPSDWDLAFLASWVVDACVRTSKRQTPRGERGTAQLSVLEKMLELIRGYDDDVPVRRSGKHIITGRDLKLEHLRRGVISVLEDAKQAARGKASRFTQEVRDDVKKRIRKLFYLLDLPVPASEEAFFALSFDPFPTQEKRETSRETANRLLARLFGRSARQLQEIHAVLGARLAELPLDEVSEAIRGPEPAPGDVLQFVVMKLLGQDQHVAEAVIDAHWSAVDS
jgi:hypothetical protein